MSDIVVGSVGVQLVPSAKGFREKTRSLLSGLVADVRLNADTTEASAKMDEAAHDREARIEANADTAAAEAKLDRAARTRKSTILPDVSGFGALTTGLLTLGPALVPITAAAGGLLAALGAPLAAAGGGSLLYFLTAKEAVKSTEKQAKAIDQLQKKVQSARTAVDQASTPSGKKTALARLAADTQAYNDALAKLNPQQRKFLQAQGNLKGSFDKLLTTAGPAVFGPLITGMNALSMMLPKLAPVLNPVSKALDGLLGEIEKSAQSGALSDFTDFLAQFSGPAITNGGHFLGNIAVGFGAIGKAFMPLGDSIGKSLLRWSDGFAKIGSSKGLKDFVGYVERVGPDVAHTLGDVGSAAGHIAKALAPVGDVALSALDGLAKGISKVPTKVLTTIGFTLAGIAVSMKAIKLANSGISLLSKIPGLGSKLGGGSSLLGSALGTGKGVTHVWVDNPGFGGAGIGGVAGSGDGRVSKILKTIPFIATAAELIHQGFLSQARDDANMAKFQAGAKKALIGAIVTGWHDAMKSQKDLQGLLNPKPANKNGSGLKLPVVGELTWDKQLLVTYSDQFKKLPKTVQTKLLTPGAVESLSDVTKLKNQYDLTPKQVRTVLSLIGAQQATANIITLRRQLDGLHDKTVNIRVVQHRTPGAGTSALVPGAQIGGTPGNGKPRALAPRSIVDPSVYGPTAANITSGSVQVAPREPTTLQLSAPAVAQFGDFEIEGMLRAVVEDVLAGS